MCKEGQFCIGKCFSYLTNGHFLGQIGGKIGQNLGQNTPSTNLIQILLRSICVPRTTIFRWKLFELFDQQSFFQGKLGQIGPKIGHKIGQSDRPWYSVRKPPSYSPVCDIIKIWPKVLKRTDGLMDGPTKSNPMSSPFHNFVASLRWGTKICL